MRAIVPVLWLLTGVYPLARAAPPPESVAILYNSAVPESRMLAELYCETRDIPKENLVALKMPLTPDISRKDYETSILLPLRKEFDQRAWWKRGRNPEGITLPVVNRIRVLVTMRGVPLRIQPTPKPAPPPPNPAKPQATPPPPSNPIAGHDEAAVDSELALFGVEGLPTDGTLQNKFYQSKKSISSTEFPFLVLTARIDAPTYATCDRMIREPVEIEKSGLWGLAYVDIANKHPLGDGWLKAIVKANSVVGIPTVVDTFNDTLPKNYPMGDAAFYFGWYDYNVSGPFLNPLFRFRKGAVAMHLHSFSAAQLSNADTNWAGPLLEKGAAVTVGNVYEPYLEMTHDFGTLYQKLLDGDCWVEACWKAIPVTSWQSVVLGDPLYQPFKHLDGSGKLKQADNDFRAFRAATLRWPDTPGERRQQLDTAIERTGSATLAETLGLDLLQQGLPEEAAARFRTAKKFYQKPQDQLRQEFHLMAIDRAANRKELVVHDLRVAQLHYGAIPETESLKAWLDILDPPPPPRADPTKTPAIATPNKKNLPPPGKK